MIVIDKEYGGLYDKDEQTGKITKVLRLFTNNDSVKFERFDYADNDSYEKATAEQLREYQCSYYIEDGSRPLNVLIVKNVLKQKIVIIIKSIINKMSIWS